MPNTGQYLTAGTVLVGPISGWYGNLSTSNNLVEDAEQYDKTYFRIPRVSLVGSPP